MKKNFLILTPLIIVMGLHANSKKVTQEEIDKVASGTTEGHYQKPGAPINMSYKSIKVDTNETADVNITLTTTAHSGTIYAMMTHDDNLTLIGDVDENLTFNILPDQKSFNINLQATSNYDGLYYIRLLTKIDKGYGPKLRSFAVPVYIGDNPKPKTRSGVTFMKATSGENISVSKAVETIEVIKDK